jgi:NodT family efflux transporter outer membrane factor (OMF) lipoprotein
MLDHAARARRRAAPAPAQSADAPVSVTNWWSGFSDPTLDTLIREGLERSPSVRLAYLRLKEARGQSRQTFGAFLPEISATGRGQYTRSINGPGLYGSTLGGVGGGGTVTPETEQAIGSYGASVSWEIPLFARLEAAAIGAKANNRAALEDVRGARVTLSADIANAYVDLRAAQNRQAALREGAGIAEQLAGLVKISADAGIASRADAADARRQAETTRATLSDIEIARTTARNQLALLRAHAPGTEASNVNAVLSTAAPVPTIALASAPAAPADLLRLRPDIVRAEAQATLAAAQVGVSRADLLPQLNLTGSLITSENLLGSPLSQLTTQAVATPIISIPLLDWGRRFAAVSVSRAKFDEALVNYESTVNNAVAEAVSALTQLEQGEQRLQAARNAESAAEITANGFRASYSAGIASLTDRLRSDQQLLDARLSRIQAESAEAKAAIGVYRAFGGGPPELSEN